MMSAAQKDYKTLPLKAKRIQRGKIKNTGEKIEAWKAGKKDKVGSILGFIKGDGQRKESSSFKIHKRQKKLEEA